ncbi:MAG: hypothetical protein ACYC5N_02080 [Endomicrobiales bacterium]
MRAKKRVQMSRLVDMTSPAAVFEEVKYNFIQQYFIEDFEDVRTTFNDFNALYEGKYPGYRACNTKFHDKIHTTDALLAVSRLIDGYNLSHRPLPVRDVKIALIATILHDTGYIQGKKDTRGTGAKYTLNHVERSIDFMKKYFREKRFLRRDLESAARMIKCTGLGTDLKTMRFRDKTERLLGSMLGSADLLGQMASRTYLERLIYLYREFREGHVKGYSSEYALLEKTLKFYATTKVRLEQTFDSVDRYALTHFRKRYRASEHLYHTAIDRQINYLKEILRHQPRSFRESLRRQIV